MVPVVSVCGNVLESCCLEWYQNWFSFEGTDNDVLESCCLEWYQNKDADVSDELKVLESCCLEWYQNFPWLILSF